MAVAVATGFTIILILAANLKGKQEDLININLHTL